MALRMDISDILNEKYGSVNYVVLQLVFCIGGFFLYSMSESTWYCDTIDNTNKNEDIRYDPVSRIFQVVEFESRRESGRYDIYFIPRSREVGQSFLMALPMTIYSFLFSIIIVWKTRPDLLLVNGPGSCIPVVFAAALFDMIRLRDTIIIYEESICRVESLSLSGMLGFFITSLKGNSGIKFIMFFSTTFFYKVEIILKNRSTLLFHKDSFIFYLQGCRPDLLLVNGPGSCIPVVFAAALFDMIRLRDTIIIYEESICRVESLSLSGSIIYFLGLADGVIVQWKQLKEKYPRSLFINDLQ
ncbi:oligosaccharide biosynthesis protein Alg14 like protein [Dictyocaulus viviparus]|uniref:UDP-N-acetylglucosamine transferase subunit ALG14 n=1 Tax=Dictyocaulus viviparus TaxID=29172 RepID=A0A0D8Y6Y3_DICVI|nr:oligosaccharide biosynthesis protein Alg14 like protein [Dictyocaulus viviparus]